MGQAGCKTQGTWACAMPHPTNLGQTPLSSPKFLGSRKGY